MIADNVEIRPATSPVVIAAVGLQWQKAFRANGGAAYQGARVAYWHSACALEAHLTNEDTNVDRCVQIATFANKAARPRINAMEKGHIRDAIGYEKNPTKLWRTIMSWEVKDLEEFQANMARDIPRVTAEAAKDAKRSYPARLLWMCKDLDLQPRDDEYAALINPLVELVVQQGMTEQDLVEDLMLAGRLLVYWGQKWDIPAHANATLNRGVFVDSMTQVLSAMSKMGMYAAARTVVATLRTKTHVRESNSVVDPGDLNEALAMAEFLDLCVSGLHRNYEETSDAPIDLQKVALETLAKAHARWHASAKERARGKAKAAEGLL